MKKNLKQALKTLVKLSISLGLIAWLINKGALDLDQFQRLASPGLIVFLLACNFFNIAINNFRWQVLLRSRGVLLNFRQTLPLSFIGVFFSYMMPGGVGGDVVKGYYILKEYPDKKMASALSILMDRVCGFFMMVLTAVIALFFNWHLLEDNIHLRSVAFAVSAVLFAFCVFFAVIFSRRVHNWPVWQKLFNVIPGGDKLSYVYTSLHAFRGNLGAFAWAVLLSGFSQFFTIVSVIAIGWQMQESLPIYAYFFVVPVGITITALPISPAGIGVGQMAFFHLFNIYLGHESAIGPTAITAIQITQLAWGMVGALIFMTRKQKIPLQEMQADEVNT